MGFDLAQPRPIVITAQQNSTPVSLSAIYRAVTKAAAILRLESLFR